MLYPHFKSTILQNILKTFWRLTAELLKSLKSWTMDTWYLRTGLLISSFELLYLLCSPDSVTYTVLRSILCALTPALFAMQHNIQRGQYTFHDPVIKTWQLRPNFAMFMWNRTSEIGSWTKKRISGLYFFIVANLLPYPPKLWLKNPII